jgi:hypothetical protein
MLLLMKVLAKAIYAMPYGHLKSVATDFAGMIDEDVRPSIKTPEEFAEMPWDWAEANKDD